MSEIASAFVSLVPSAKGFGTSTERQIGPQMSGVAKRTGSKFGKVFASSSLSPLRAIGTAAVGLFAVKEVKDFFKASIGEARESQKVGAITANVIRTTGKAANISAAQVGNLSTAISNKTGIDDEAIQSGANLLLTFTNIRNEAGKGNDVFNQATQSITDLGAAMGKDPKSAAIQLGKALNDPVKGITALTRVGVSFTDQQKTQIATLVKSGNTLAAQKIILHELGKEFGGTAAAASTNGEKLATNFANFKEAIGTAVLPYLDRFEGALSRLVLKMTTGINPAFKSFKKRIAPIADAFTTISGVVNRFVRDNLKPFLATLSGLGSGTIASFALLIGGTLVDAIGIFVATLSSPIFIIGALAGAAVYAYKNFAGFRTTVDNLATSFQQNILPQLKVFGAYLISTVIPNVVAFSQTVAANVVPILRQMASIFVTDILPILRDFGSFLVTTVIPIVVNVSKVVATQLAPVFKQLAQTFKTDVLPTIQKLLVKFHEAQPALQKIAAFVLRWDGTLLKVAATIIGHVLPPVIRFAGFMFKTVIPAVAAVITVIIKIIGKIAEFGSKVLDAVGKVAQFVKGIKTKFSEAVAFVKSIPGKVKAALGAVGTLLYQAGRDLIQGMINGVKSMAESLANSAKDAASGAVNGVKGLLGIHSPSRVFHEIGVNTIRGLVNGISERRGTQKVKAAVKKIVEAVAGLAAATKLDASVVKFTSHLADMLDRVGKKAPQALKKMADAVRATVKQATTLTDHFKNIADAAKNVASTVADAFKPDLLSGSLGDFFANGLTSKASLTALKSAFAKLKSEGLDKKFLSTLFQSGNTDLILQLASGSSTTALSAQSLFNTDNALATQLGNSVSQNTYGQDLRSAVKELRDIKRILDHQGTEFAHALKAEANRGKRRRKQKAAAK